MHIIHNTKVTILQTGLHLLLIAFAFVGAISLVCRIVTFVLWIICMVAAYQGKRFMLPIVGDIAVKVANRRYRGSLAEKPTLSGLSRVSAIVGYILIAVG